MVKDIVERLRFLDGLKPQEAIEAINEIRLAIHGYSPFKDEPVDCVQWVKGDMVEANDYNPNAVAPPEMKLLELSIEADGYTQPIVTWSRDGKFEVVDGFHRNRVGKESLAISQRLKGYLPVVAINEARQSVNDRISSTIRHNRARGKHQIDAMSDIVIELKRRNWTNEKICRELGMEMDEVLRLCQITGLAELFEDQDFSMSWDVEGHIDETDFEELTDNVSTYGEDIEARTMNTNDPNRIFHTHDKWECYKAGFYNTTVDGMTAEECKLAYREFLADIPRFNKALAAVTSEWVYSCEHYLTNKAMNRIAWLGQAAACYDMGIPSTYRGGFSLLTEKEQEEANAAALVYLNKWLENNGLEVVSMDDACSGRQSDIY